MKKETMTSRQRVIETINHRIPDRMPIDLGMYSATGISAFAYWGLREYLNLPIENIEIHEEVQLLARVDEDILEKFHCDCILLKPRAKSYHKWNPRGKYRFDIADYCNPKRNDKDEWEVIKGNQKMRMPQNGYFFDEDWISLTDIWADDYFADTVKEAERIYKETDYFTAFRGFHPFFEQNMDYFCAMLEEPEKIALKNEHRLKMEIDKAVKVIKAMGNYVGAICMSGDLGMQSAPMCSPSAFEESVFPYLKEFCSFVHRNSDIKIFLHSCGAIEPLLPLLIEAGIDIINPVQISAKGMDAYALKQKYGKDIVFWGGGCNTQEVLGIKSPAEAAQNVAELTSIFKPNGGYVFNCVHNIMGNVSPESIVAVYEAAYKNSFYE